LYVDCCIEAIYNDDVDAVVGQKVTLPCNEVTSNSSLRWLYRQTKLSNAQPIFTAMAYETVLRVFQPSGRLAANRSSFETFTLLIYEVQLADSGFYGCVSNISYHITRLSVQRKHLFRLQVQTSSCTWPKDRFENSFERDSQKFLQCHTVTPSLCPSAVMRSSGVARL